MYNVRERPEERDEWYRQDSSQISENQSENALKSSLAGLHVLYKKYLPAPAVLTHSKKTGPSQQLCPFLISPLGPN